MRRYYHQWFNVEVDGIIRRAKCIDIEFDGGLGPLFLMMYRNGETFWMTREEIKNNTK